MSETNSAGDIRVARIPHGWVVQRFVGSTLNPNDKVWVTDGGTFTEREARDIAGLGPRKGHRAEPSTLSSTEAECLSCGGRVVARANRHGFFVWSHRKAGR